MRMEIMKKWLMVIFSVHSYKWGIFENYLKCKISDFGATDKIRKPKIEQAVEWLTFYDALEKQVTTNMMYEFMGYMAFPATKFYQLFASPILKFRLEYPKQTYQCLADLKTNENIVSSFVTGITANLRPKYPKKSISTELIPYLLQIIGPEMKSANVQVLKPNEKAKISQIVETMSCFGLKLVQFKQEDATYNYRLEP